MKIVIHNPALTGPDIIRWGDYHFGCSLEKALKAAGPKVEQRFWPDWNQPVEADTLLVLRGNRAWLPPPGPKNLLWIVSNSSTISNKELDHYDVIFAASETLRKRLALMTKRPVHLLRQCTDTSIFHPPNEPINRQVTERDGVILVGNSRSILRPVVDWAVKAGIHVDLYGNRWPLVGLSHLVRQDHIANEDLPALYRRSRISLNDHWADMQHDQIISNRIFDCLACGLPVISDWFPELEDVFGEAVNYARDPATLRQTIENAERDYARFLEAAQHFARIIALEHSFDARARDILEAAEHIAKPHETQIQTATEALSREKTSSMLKLDLSRPYAETRALHINPSPAATHDMVARGFKNYRSAGFGPGPWHIALDDKLAVLGTQEYDLILVETGGMSISRRLAFSMRLARNIKKKGVMIHSPSDATGSFCAFLAPKIRWLRKVMLYMLKNLQVKL